MESALCLATRCLRPEHCAILTRKFLADSRAHPQHPIDSPATLTPIAWPWLLGNTLFVLCIGSGWGFNHFPRFNIPAQPALFYALSPLLPRHWIWWALFTAGSFATAVFTVMH